MYQGRCMEQLRSYGNRINMLLIPIFNCFVCHNCCYWPYPFSRPQDKFLKVVVACFEKMVFCLFYFSVKKIIEFFIYYTSVLLKNLFKPHLIVETTEFHQF